MTRRRWTTDPQYDFLFAKMNTYFEKKLETDTNHSALTTFYHQTVQQFQVKWPDTPRLYQVSSTAQYWLILLS